MKKVWCGNGGQDSVSLSVVQHSKLTFRPAPDGSNLSFKSKTIKGRTYWYLYVSLGRRRTEHYLGAETPELLEVLDKERGLWASTADDRRVRSRLVSMLLAGGATETRGDEGKSTGVAGTRRRFFVRWCSDRHDRFSRLCESTWKKPGATSLRRKCCYAYCMLIDRVI